MDENKKTPEVIIEDETTQSDIFGSFDEAPAKKTKKKKTTATTKTLIIFVCAVAVLGTVLLTLLFMPQKTEELSTDGTASVTSVPDKNKVWQADLKIKDGKIVKNGAGELLSLIPSDVKTIKLKNSKGTTIITSYTPKTKETDSKTGKIVEKTEAIQYTVKGFEGYDLQSGEPDEIASVCTALSFKSVSCVDAGDKLSDFGFDKPRSVATVTYNDGTKSIITVGANAPQNLGTYVMFGSKNAVFLCETEATDHLMYGVNDLLSRAVSAAASDTENSSFKALTISGRNFGSAVVLKPNQSSEIQCDYVITLPNHTFADNTEASGVAGGIRGLNADKVMAVNPDTDRLKKLGLESPYAEIKAVYPDETISFIASKPDSDGNCSLMKKGGKIVYKISAEKIAWVNSSYEKLMSETVLEVDLKTVKALRVADYSFDIMTKTINTTDDKGEESSTTETKTFYNGKELDKGNFETFFSNLSLLKKSEKTASKPSGKAALKVTYSYSSDRGDDILVFYKNGAVTVNGVSVGTVNVSYVEKLKVQAKAVSKGDEVRSFW